MEILEAYDLTGSFRAAAGLVGRDHKTVAYWVRQREPGTCSKRVRVSARRCLTGQWLVDRRSGWLAWSVTRLRGSVGGR
jgi:hypothetical protein